MSQISTFPLVLALLGSAAAVLAGAPDLGRLEPFKPGEVKLKDGLLKRSFDANLRYLKSLDDDMLLFCYRFSAYLRYPGSPPGGWEAPLNPNRGTFLGHWLSGAARAFALSGDRELKLKAERIVGGLRKCQIANGGGWVEAWGPERVFIMEGKHGGDPAFDVITAPYYGVHKLMAGLIDMHSLAGSGEALVTARALADWLLDRCAALPDTKLQQMLDREHGGIVESLSDLAAVTGDGRYVDLARRMRHHAVVDPLARGEDRLAGLHANTQLPKFNGDGSLHRRFGDAEPLKVLRNAYDIISSTRTFATGGSSSREFWGPAGKLEETLGASTEESCTTYNWMKMARYLLSFEGAARYGDMLERCLFSGLLPAQNPETGMFIYFLPLTRGGARKDWGTPTDSFWCCYGTMVESFGDPAEGAYLRAPGLLAVNLFVPSEVVHEGLRVEQDTGFPESDRSKLTVHAATPKKLTLAVRIPSWAKGAGVTVNGEAVAAEPGTFCRIERSWSEGDAVELKIPMAPRWEPLTGSEELKAAVVGPVVLGGITPVPLGMERKDPVLEPAGPPLRFTAAGLLRPGRLRSVPFQPLYSIADQPYGVYFPSGRPAILDAEYAAFADRVEDEVLIADAGDEKAHGLRETRSGTGRAPDGQTWRHAVDGWFEYRLKAVPAGSDLAIKYWGGETGDRAFEVLVDGRRLETRTLKEDAPGKFFWARAPIPREWTEGRDSVTVRFQARPGNTAGGIFGLAVLRR
jgi:DUF1680 family protein